MKVVMDEEKFIEYLEVTAGKKLMKYQKDLIKKLLWRYKHENRDETPTSNK